MKFEDYIKMARKTIKPDKMTDAEILADYIGENLRLCREAIRHAEQMNWGSKAHIGLRTLAEIKPLYTELNSRLMSVTEDELSRVCKLRSVLCDTMWLSEHHL